MSTASHDQSPAAFTPKRIGIIGAGPVGVAMAKILVRAGHSVSISNSRGPETIRRQEKETGASATDVQKGVVDADVIVLAVPTGNLQSVYKILQASSLRPGAIVLDACNYYPPRDGRVEELDKGLPDSVWVSQNVSAPVAKAFNNIIAANIVTSAKPKASTGERVAIPVSADDSTALKTVMALVEEVGFAAYNAGALADSWRYQPGQPAYCTEPVPKELPDLLARADREEGPIGRDKARGWIEKLPADYSPYTLVRIARLSVGLDRWNIRSWLAAISFAFALSKASIKG